jgi:hypothetical protein
MPLPDALRTLLDRQWEKAQQHRYAYSVGIAAPPLLDIYVEQHAERLAQGPMLISGGDGRAGRLTLAQMLKENRSAVVLAEPGVGKSTAIAQVMWEQCSWWRDARRSAKPRAAPYGPVIPVVLPADLHGCDSLPGALALQWKRLTDTEPDIRMFGRPPSLASSWLVLIDGIDQVLSAQARKEVLERLGAWITEAAPHYRFMITSRPLLGWELGYLSFPGISPCCSRSCCLRYRPVSQVVVEAAGRADVL